MPNKMFAERLNAELDTMDLPTPLNERSAAVSKWLKIPVSKADSILNGMVPEPEVVQRLADELEVTASWLIGENN